MVDVVATEGSEEGQRMDVIFNEPIALSVFLRRGFPGRFLSGCAERLDCDGPPRPAIRLFWPGLLTLLRR